MNLVNPSRVGDVVGGEVGAAVVVVVVTPRVEIRNLPSGPHRSGIPNLKRVLRRKRHSQQPRPPRANVVYREPPSLTVGNVSHQFRRARGVFRHQLVPHGSSRILEPSHYLGRHQHVALGLIGVAPASAAVIAAAAGFTLRAVAIRFRLALPAYPGRDTAG